MNKALKLFLVGLGLAGMATACAPDPNAPAGPMDFVAPVISAVDVSPVEVAPGQNLNISATVSDDVGVTGVVFVARFNELPAGFCSDAAVLTSGTPQFGIWELNCIVPAVLNAGSYQMNVLAVDGGFNSDVTVDGEPSATSGHFTVTGETNDLDAPAVVTVVSTPSSVAPGESLTISANITDVTGVANAGFVARIAGNAPGWCAAGATLVTGTAQDGVWELTCDVPADAFPGDYIVNTGVSDLLNNVGGLGDDAPVGANGAFTVTAAPAA